MKKEFEQEQIGTSPTIAPHGGTEDTEKRILLRQGFHLRLAYGGQERRTCEERQFAVEYGNTTTARVAFTAPSITR